MDQWGESGYLFYEGHVYQYMEDRKDQWGRTYNKMSVEEFFAFVKKIGIEIPEEFRKKIQS